VSRSRLDPDLTLAEIDDAVRSQLESSASLYSIDESVLTELGPDVIVTQDLCAVCAVDVSSVDDALAALRCDASVVSVDPQTLDEVLASIRTLGAVAGREDAAAELARSLRARVAAVRHATEGRTRPRVLVLEWTDPPFGPGHWVPDLVEAAGATALCARRGAASVRLGWDEVTASPADVVIVAPCGFHLDAATAVAIMTLADPRLPRGAAVWAIDADAVLVRPGPRIVDGIEALATIFHPGVVPLREELVRYVGTTSANTNPSRSTT